MKKILLTSIFMTMLATSAYCNNQIGNNQLKHPPRPNGNSNIQSPAASDMGGIQSHRKMINQRRASKQHLGGVAVEDMRAPRGPGNLKGSRPAKGHKHAHHAKDNDNKDDENPNLANLATPAPENIRNNLSIPDEDRALRRQMMLDGPQGGFQNNQPRGIGGTRANF